MSSRQPLLEVAANRKRKSHRKSRQGCGNCKIRRVKCDESRPRCQKCEGYGVSCNYGSSAPDIQLLSDGTFDVITMPKLSRPSMNQTISGMMNMQSESQTSNNGNSFPVYQIKTIDLELLFKFQTRTALTVGTATTCHIFAESVTKLAFTQPYLMHIILTMSLRHDRFLSASQSTTPSTSEVYHWYQGTSMFNQVLSKPIKLSERDALWAAAAMLGTLSFSSLETRSPEDAWPLKPPSAADLDWLKMSDGKKAVYEISQPARADSIFRHMVKDTGFNVPAPTSLDSPEFSSLPADFLSLFELDSVSLQRNPYYAPLWLVASVMSMDCTHTTILRFLSFISHMGAEYKRLVEEKDKKALLILSYWYAKLCAYNQWWIWRRAVMECQSICIYLERYHADDVELLKHLRFPRMMSGMWEQ